MFDTGFQRVDVLTDESYFFVFIQAFVSVAFRSQSIV